jgi:hypothetical protein
LEKSHQVRKIDSVPQQINRNRLIILTKSCFQRLELLLLLSACHTVQTIERKICGLFLQFLATNCSFQATASITLSQLFCHWPVAWSLSWFASKELSFSERQ